MMSALTITNSQAAQHEFFVRELAASLAKALEMPVKLVSAGAWDEREARLDAGEIDLGWICGAPYVYKRERAVPLEPLAAPVMGAPRYGSKPVYFSDVIVRAASPYFTFADLQGARWAYSEPHSYSGYHAVRHYLALHRWNRGFFGAAVATGAHAQSVKAVLENRVDASAIDSTVLELLYASNQNLRDRLRVVETLGPSPMPLFVAGAHLDAKLRSQIQTAMTQLHQTEMGRELLDKAQMLRLAPIADSEYDTIRQRLHFARRVQL